MYVNTRNLVPLLSRFNPKTDPVYLGRLVDQCPLWSLFEWVNIYWVCYVVGTCNRCFEHHITKYGST